MRRLEFPASPGRSKASLHNDVQDWLYIVTGLRSRIMDAVIKKGGDYTLPCYKVASMVADDIARWGGPLTPQKYINKAAEFTIEACARHNPRRRA
jgi:hypothetical protein